MAHAKARAKERYGIDLTDQDIKNIVKMIRVGKTKCVHKTSNKRSIHLVFYRAKEMYAVYDKSWGDIVTFLKPGYTKHGRVGYLIKKNLRTKESIVNDSVYRRKI